MVSGGGGDGGGLGVSWLVMVVVSWLAVVMVVMGGRMYMGEILISPTPPPTTLSRLFLPRVPIVCNTVR